ncbi:glucose 1,6-bisphosphate synthase [Leptopilina boulardi]|uniref:glucose 1,6-bisphosphate synthase n=1 Tax=Leptopilina boulardi TaxID=63433 RepID=UPI0021F5BF09|nr:glucose 1,6-bisphosphate synthase [Leptopilina boulardi]XP_051155001.1 glucose 1,6-bisphosphate synthase [Leptopilina boulardi]XP_051155002.1 glucose 1,6-bisphosphate synthase [Leptopilina boulardi]
MAPLSSVNTGNPELDEKITEWFKWNKDPNADVQIQSLIKNNDTGNLLKLFLKRLEFGTAGIRGRMGPGFNQMNDLVIIQTSQGLAKYLLDTVGNVEIKGVILGYDGRHNSKRFAELTASIFLNKQIKVYMYSKVCPTPFIPYGVLKYKCGAGIMITASHNPKDDNGYKVYWENGAQIISPHDKGIQKCILENLEPLDSSWNTKEIYQHSLFNDPLNDVLKEYYNDLKNDVLYSNINENTILKFTYTAMHGVGFNYMSRAFETANFKPFIVVEEQKDPDPEFPTVKFPNPEEGKSALNLSIETANRNSSTIILANDPDADRLACAVKGENNEWQIFSGNELGALLGWWMMHVYKVRYPGNNLAETCMLASTVSSKILQSMAKKEGFQFEETLTGFKWMGNKSIDLMKEGKHVLFAFEEAIGFMCGQKVLDKDGISAGTRLAEMAAYLETMGLSLREKLNEIYAEYGHHISENSYWICHEQETIKCIFERLRNFNGKPNTYPTSILGEKYPIIGVRDLTTGYDNSKPDNKAILPISKSSQMITFTFKNGLVTTLRTSGTEPKIKYYNELCGTPCQKDIKVLKNTLKEMVDAIVSEFLQPELNCLIPRSD